MYNTNHAKTTGPIAAKCGTRTKVDIVVNMSYLVSSVVMGVPERRATKILHVNVHCVAPPGGGGRGYYKSLVEVTFIFALYMSPDSGKLQSQPLLIRGGRGRGGVWVWRKENGVRW